MAIVVDQKRLGGGMQSTLGTVSDIAPMLRLLFERVGQPQVGNVDHFSFNTTQGMCPVCNGVGRKVGVDLEAAIDQSKSLG